MTNLIFRSIICLLFLSILSTSSGRLMAQDASDSSYDQVQERTIVIKPGERFNTGVDYWAMATYLVVCVGTSFAGAFLALLVFHFLFFRPFLKKHFRFWSCGENGTPDSN